MLRFTILLICILAPLTISTRIKQPKYDTVCNNHCEYGYILDENCRSTCQCKQRPCENGQAPLSGYFCGRGPNHTDCPPDSVCNIAPNDAYAVCCPSNQQSVTEPMKTTIKSVTKSPCENGQAPLSGYFCGRGLNRTDCPPDSVCNIAPNDAYAVCCPSNQQSVTEPMKTTIKSVTKALTKPGSCPPSFHKLGTCMVSCTTDYNCQGRLKCCHGCCRKRVRSFIRKSYGGSEEKQKIKH